MRGCRKLQEGHMSLCSVLGEMVGDIKQINDSDRMMTNLMGEPEAVSPAGL